MVQDCFVNDEFFSNMVLRTHTELREDFQQFVLEKINLHININIQSTIEITMNQSGNDCHKI